MFGNHIDQTTKGDDASVTASLSNIARAVMGSRLVNAASRQEAVQNLIEQLFRCFGIKFEETVEAGRFNSIDEQLDYYLKPQGIMRREVKLKNRWYSSSIGVMMGTLKADGTHVLLMPNAMIGYSYLDTITGKRYNINRKLEGLFEEDAVCFYRPLPKQSLTAADLLKFGAKQLSVGDNIFMVLAILLLVALSLITPMFTQTLFGIILPSGDITFLAAMAVFMALYALSGFLLSVFRGIARSRIVAKADTAVRAALFGRMLRLPSSFFTMYSTGDLALRIDASEKLCSSMSDGIISVGLTCLFSFAYIFQIISLTPGLVLPVILITVITAALSLLIGYLMNRHNNRLRIMKTKLRGVEHSILSDIRKIKTTGSEKRAYSKWAEHYANKARLESNPNMLLGLHKTVMLAVPVLGMVAIYLAALSSNIDSVAFYAFMTSYGMLSGALSTLTGLMLSIADVKSISEMVKPILQEQTEDDGRHKTVAEISGRIILEHISFSYREKTGNILDDFSLSINRGEYLAIVGKTGSGKSTIFKILLGFEQPQKGAVYFDGEDIKNLDLRSLRGKCGVVLQNAALFPGDIYYNIIISKPTATMDEAWAAAERAAIADDIRALPMGMRTYISEGGGGISGGQRQQLLIARALVSDPSLLLFDEATSALDNETQEKVTRSIEELGCTRVVIAHRLSTVRNADRIVVLDKGHIVEEGSYESLMAKRGAFAELVARQQLDRE